VLIFYEARLSPCATQLKSFAEARSLRQRDRSWSHRHDSPETQGRLAAYEGSFPFPLLSDAKLDAFKAYRCVDFKSQALHGTF
jgi:peroxiredoxin